MTGGKKSNLAGIDVTDELGNTLGRVRPLLQQDNRCGLEKNKEDGMKWSPKSELNSPIYFKLFIMVCEQLQGL